MVTQTWTGGDEAGASSDAREDILARRRLLLASNRGPVDYRIGADGRLVASRGAGGVVSALAALSEHTRVTWISAAMSEADRLAADMGTAVRPNSLPATLDHRLIAISDEVFDLHYNVISNPMLWFIQHYLWNPAYTPVIDRAVRTAWTRGYETVNAAFGRALARLAQPRPGERAPFVMVHDYQLYLAPRYLRALVPDAIISHFTHIPWPAPGYLQLLPHAMRNGIVEALCQADVIGFQTSAFARNFLNCCADFLPGADVEADAVHWRGRSTQVKVYPISVDVEQLRRVAASPVCEGYVERLAARSAPRTIVRIDRLDPSKNVVRGFQAYRALLERRPDLRGQVSFLAFLVPSRTGIAEYQEYRDRAFAEVEEINRHFGTGDWQPITLFYENNFVQAVAAMRLADVVLVNPVADGMNLVAKEAVTVNQRDAVLVLSETAGAYEQLRGGAIGVSPGDVEGTAEVLEKALAMPLMERLDRLRRMRRVIENQDLTWWVDEQLSDLGSVAERRVAAIPSPAMAAGA